MFFPFFFQGFEGFGGDIKSLFSWWFSCDPADQLQGVPRTRRTQVSRRVSPRVSPENGGVRRSVPRIVSGPLRVPGVSKKCPESVPECPGHLWDTLGTLFGHCGARGPQGPRDTPWDTPSDTPVFRDALGDTPRDTRALRARGTPCSWSAGSQRFSLPLWRFSLLFKGFEGFGGDKKSLFFWWFSLPFPPPKKGKDSEEVNDAQSLRTRRISTGEHACDPNVEKILPPPDPPFCAFFVSCAFLVSSLPSPFS